MTFHFNRGQQKSTCQNCWEKFDQVDYYEHFVSCGALNMLSNGQNFD